MKRQFKSCYRLSLVVLLGLLFINADVRNSSLTSEGPMEESLSTNSINYGSAITLKSYHNKYLQTGKGGSKKAWENLTIINAGNTDLKSPVKFGDHIILRTHYRSSTDRGYVFVKEDGTLTVTNKRRNETKFTLINPDNTSSTAVVDIRKDKLAFKSNKDKYLYNNDKGEFFGNGNRFGLWGQWTIAVKIKYGNAITLYSYHNKYLQTGKGGSKKAWENLTVINAGKTDSNSPVRFGDRIILRTHRNSDTDRGYVFVKEDGTLTVSNKRRNETKFTLINPDNPGSKAVVDIRKDKLAFKSSDGKYLAGKPNGNSIADRSRIGSYEQWTVNPDGFVVTINGLLCLQSADTGNATDEPYFEVFVDDKSSPIKIGPKEMNEESTTEWWVNPGSFYAKEKVIIKLWEEDSGGKDKGTFEDQFKDNDDYIGEVVITESTKNGDYILKKFRSEEEGNWDLFCSIQSFQNQDTDNIKTYAPLLYFDSKQGTEDRNFPQDAKKYFDNKGDVSKSQNLNYQSISSGKIPVYYQHFTKDTEEGKDLPEGVEIIQYWFFYAWQNECWPGKGSHPSDWERIAVKIVDNELEAVMYFQHGGWYTRTKGNFMELGSHPVVYVGKNSHGSYHDSGGIGGCLYFDDFRKPGKKNQKMETWKNLVSCESKSVKDWMNDTFWDDQCGFSPLKRSLDIINCKGCSGPDVLKVSKEFLLLKLEFDIIKANPCSRSNIDSSTNFID